MGVFISVLFTMPGILENITSIQEVSSEVKVLENSIRNTDVNIVDLEAEAGSIMVNFTLNNNGTEKLWDFENFNLLITYDADIGGIKTPVTEEFIYAESLIAEDFKIQRGALIMTGATATITSVSSTDFDVCTGDCFIKITSTRHTGIGDNIGGGVQNPEETTADISDVTGLTTAGTITFTRDNGGGTFDTRINWEIWEYIGDVGGVNEMQVLDIGTCTFSGPSTCVGSMVSPSNDADVVVFITGSSAIANSRSNSGQDYLITSFLNGFDMPVFTRGVGVTSSDSVSYAVVEFSGSNWVIQQAGHVFTSSPTQTETGFIPVNSIDRTFLHIQQRNDDGTAYDNIGNTGAEVELTATDTITLRLPNTVQGWGPNMNGAYWIIENTETSSGKDMVVQHLNPAERFASDISEGANNEEDEWSVSINTVREMDETAITSASSQSKGNGTGFPRGNIAFLLDTTSNVKAFHSDDLQAQEYTFSVVQFPRSEKDGTGPCFGGFIRNDLWTIDSITNDLIEPSLLNPNEGLEVCSGLLYPIFPGGDIAVIFSTDRGIRASAATTVP